MNTETKQPHPVLDVELLQGLALGKSPAWPLDPGPASVLAGEYLLLRSTLSDALDIMQRLSPDYCDANDVEQTTDDELDEIIIAMKELLA